MAKTPLFCDPILHSHIEDCLEDDHPWAFQMIKCEGCGELVHASNNECMQTWLEIYLGGGKRVSYCVNCFKITEVISDYLEDNLK